jgi:dihydrofolate synthase/folylpolyglutamate synthase
VTYPEAIEFLYRLQWFGTKFGLENTIQLAALAGNPQHSLRFIHVAGTNGKGSTCAMLEAIYRAAGLRVGLFTSPHLISFGERIQVNRVPISETDIIRQVTELQPLLANFSKENHPTFFEVVTVMALRYFIEQKCDLVVWETGLGGRLDATNIVTPIASVITNVQYDHQKWLGNTLEEIAGEKAGIIKPGVPVTTATDEGSALQVIVNTATRLSAPLVVLSREQVNDLTKGVELALLGEHQHVNAALALATVEMLRSQIPVQVPLAQNALQNVRWPGRLQLLSTASGQRFLLDGAHNLAGAQSLSTALACHFPGAHPALVLGILEDKDCAAICEKLAPLASRILLTKVQSGRSALPGQLAEFCRKANPSAKVSQHPELKAALGECKNEPFVLITGSLYLIGEALEILQGPGPADERGLNEWGQTMKL